MGAEVVAEIKRSHHLEKGVVADIEQERRDPSRLMVD
jgi:hypothetical protein